MKDIFEYLWVHGRLGLLVSALLAGGAGLVTTGFIPRGPVTIPQALWSLVSTLLLGLLVGLISGSRWSMLVAPAAYLMVFELGRLGLSGPTVDVIQLDSIYGVIALLTGRLFHGLLALLPILVGARFGIALARQLGHQTAAELGFTGWFFAGLGAVVLAVLAVVLLRPGTTHPIIGSDGKLLPGSIAELSQVSLGGREQTVMIRGRSADNPVLLFLAGGPGGTDLGAVRDDVALEQDFVVAVWDQPGTGKSYPAIDPLEKMTLEQMVSDTIELTNFLRERFDQEKIYLVGNSWGTILGVLAVQRQPDLYHAFVGTGQMVSPRETDTMFWEDTLAWAEQTGNNDLAAELIELGPPPYSDLLLYEPLIQHEHDWNPYPGQGSSEEMPFNTFVPENSLMDRINAMRGLLDTYSALYPQLQELDFRQDALKLDLPVYLVLGEYEARGRKVLAQEWYSLLQAPAKQLIIFENSGHRPNFEEPGRFAAIMRGIIRETYPGN